jgi:hypothetical protein
LFRRWGTIFFQPTNFYLVAGNNVIAAEV